MTKKVLILSGSPRKGGNTDILCDEFLKGAVEAGNDAEKIFVSEKNIGYCKGCYYCSEHSGECFQKDDMKEILDKIEAADILVLASPVYFYSICAQLKTVIDRCVAKWTEINNKEFYYIASSGDEAKDAGDCTFECFRGLAKCFSSSVEKGVIFAPGMYPSGAVKNTEYATLAYEMGKNV